MATSPGSPPLWTCHTDLSVENKEYDKNVPEYGTFKEPRDWWESTNRRQKRQSY